MTRVSAAAAVRGFFALNKQACGYLKPLLPHARAALRERFGLIVTGCLSTLRDGAVVVDVGGGKRSRFMRRATDSVKVLALDVSAEELRDNDDVDAKVVADAVQSLPFRQGGVDLIVSSSVLEHLPGTEAFIQHASAALRAGGYFIHLFPCRYAPFALLNQLLPHRSARKILQFFRPGSEGRLGFRAFYDQCYPSAMRRLLNEAGFDEVDIHVAYYQSSYFAFFLPLFVLSVLYELCVYALGVQDLCAYALVVARKAPSQVRAVPRAAHEPARHVSSVVAPA